MQQSISNVNHSLIALLTLWLRAKDILYIPYHLPFLQIAHLLDLYDCVTEQGTQPHTSIPNIIAPDICAGCLTEYGTTVGGRVRQRCCACQSISYKDAFYNEPWQYRIGQLLNMREEYVAAHMAIALRLHKDMRTYNDKQI